MKKVTVFVGSAHKHNTHKAVVQFMQNLQALGGVEYEIVTMSDYKLGLCRGCRLCFEKGSEFCPMKDDRDVLLAKIDVSDGVVFATPNYTWHVSGIMKAFLDRVGFICHRPRFFGKTFTSIVTQGFMGGGKIVDYFDFLANTLGFNPVKGVTLTTLDPRTEKAQRKIDKQLTDLSKRFHARLAQPQYPVPSLIMLAAFRAGRSSMIELLDDRSLDYRYYAEKGWLTSDYYYPVQLGLIRNAAGRLFDKMTPAIRNIIG